MFVNVDYCLLVVLSGGFIIMLHGSFFRSRNSKQNYYNALVFLCFYRKKMLNKSYSCFEEGGLCLVLWGFDRFCSIFEGSLHVKGKLFFDLRGHFEGLK